MQTFSSPTVTGNLIPTVPPTWVVTFALFLFAGFTQASEKPLQVFVLVGQSNMQGHADVRTFPHMAADPTTEPVLRQMISLEGEPVVCENVWISSLSNTGEKTGRLTTGFGASESKIGPELMFGIRMQQHLDQPILIIKTAWGGKSLNTDFRPPSAGSYEFSKSQLDRLAKKGKDIQEVKALKVAATGVYYAKTVEHVRDVLNDIQRVYPGYDADQGYELAGLVWFQGWNDMVDLGTYPNREATDGYRQYSELLALLISDLRRDLAAPRLPVVVGVMGVGGPTERYLPSQRRIKTFHQNFRDAMAAVAGQPAFQGNVVNVFTEECWDSELSGLRIRESEVTKNANQEAKQKQLDRNALRALKDEMLSAEFTNEELNTLRTGVSNAEYHYLGSAKIMASIGKAFADAMPENSSN
ncbi:protein of unknown function [Neorhodopirellula lusitana]|uniref:Sialate O-acetylesterase domain-containing protein n=1 Tax=Neorhodopirellula lusitana TaxID=445327 RepID=A0ABY1PSQ0_9BACT|nr:sialate O-acetylesterase [Neorhodopirellula lusitana]SMP44446.1 protein of unknown function [Neorhodopirellula lusitana]